MTSHKENARIWILNVLYQYSFKMRDAADYWILGVWLETMKYLIF